VLTGLNDAFIISGEKRNEILNNCISQEERKRTEGLIRPLLRGRDIKKYSCDWANLWLLWIPWHFPLQFDSSIQGASIKAEIEFERLYPSVYAHMLIYKKQLSNRNKAETGIHYEWYALQRWGANYWEDFAKPKIIFQEIVQESQFFFDNKGTFFCNDTGRIIVGNNLYFLLGILNSSLFFYSIKHFYGGGVLGENGIRMKHTFFQSFPCAKINKSITQLTVSLLVKYDKSLFDFLDKKIMKIYNLTDEEIQEVLNN